MEDCNERKKEHYDGETAEIPTKINATGQNFVNLHNTKEVFKELVNWCRDNREDKSEAEAQTLGIYTEFCCCRGNKKRHNKFSDLTHLTPRELKPKKKVSNKDRIGENTKRKNELSFFISETHQLRKYSETELTQENKQKAQSQSCNAASSSAPARDKLFKNNGSGLVFDFKHFADPEEVVLQYINAHVYNRTRLAKVDKKKILDSLIALHNIQKEASNESNQFEGIEDRDEAGNFFHSVYKKSITNVEKFEKRWPIIENLEREMATNNFVFEFGALNVLRSQNTMRNDNASLINGNKKDHLKTTKYSDTRKKSRAFRKPEKTISLLPRLQSTELLATNIKNEETDNFSCKTLLPNIPRGKNSGPKMTQTGPRSDDKKRLNFDVNDEAKNVKSNWQLMKQRRNLTVRKDLTNTQNSQSLYDTLEKMSTELCKMQRSKASDDYLPKSGQKFLKKGQKLRINNAEMKIPNYLHERIEDGKDFDKNLLKSNDKKSSLKKVSTKNGISVIKSEYKDEILREKTASAKSSEKKTTVSKSEAEKYLDKYSLKLIKNSEKKTVSYPSSEAVADMLAKLNIYDVGFYIDEEKKVAEMSAVTNRREFESLLAPIDKTVAGMETEADFSNRKEVGFAVDRSEDMRIEREFKKSNTAEQSSGTNKNEKILMIKKENAFIKMGLNGLEEKIPKHISSCRILRSDFLKKDLSLKPINYFKNSINFKNLLNSSSQLIFSAADVGSGKYLQERIRQIVANGVRNSSKNGEEKQEKNQTAEKFKNDYKKLREIVDKKLNEKQKEDKKFVKISTRNSFANKFLEVQNQILLNPRLQAVLPGLVGGLVKISKWEKTR